MEDIIGYGMTAMGGALSWFFMSNVKLKEGMSDALLKRLNKTKINHIPLTKHRIFGALRQKRSSFTYFILDDPVKIEFYTRYVSITFDALEEMATNIAALSLDKDDITGDIFKELDTSTIAIDKGLNDELRIPESIKVQFGQWRAMLRSSFRDSLMEILNDDLVDSNYFLAYRSLDTMISNVKVILHSGALEFSRINGAFKDLTIEDILK